jgi:hypothetical protein
MASVNVLSITILVSIGKLCSLRHLQEKALFLPSLSAHSSEAEEKQKKNSHACWLSPAESILLLSASSFPSLKFNFL